jgi:raffinose/stachyose/melibiose transport system substrate-binding protein
VRFPRRAHRASSARRARSTRSAAIALSAGLALLATACVPGTDGSGAVSGGAAGATAVPDPGKAGKTTLTIWDQETAGASDAELKRLNKEFEQKYPNVTIKRVSRSFNDLKTTLKLALSGANPPDVVQANQGYPDMVAFVKAGLLRPLDDYAGIYGWNTRYPSVLLNPNRVSVDGTRFGTGRLYGVSQAGEFVGVYYNKKNLKKAGVKPPKTWGDLERALPKLKATGIQPIQFGNLEKSPAIHLFGMLQNRFGDAQQIRDTVYGRGSYDTAAVRKAAGTLGEWSKRGYLPKGSNGLASGNTVKNFAEGKGGFVLAGTWTMAELAKPMGDNVAMIAPPPATAGAAPVATGGPSLAWAATSRSKHPEVAAAYIDHITNAHASDVLTEEGMLPAVPGRKALALDPQTPDGQMVTGWQALSGSDGLVPYLDYSTPTFYNTISAALQGAISGKLSGDQVAETLQKDYAGFRKKQQAAAGSGKGDANTAKGDGK